MSSFTPKIRAKLRTKADETFDWAMFFVMAKAGKFDVCEVGYNLYREAIPYYSQYVRKSLCSKSVRFTSYKLYEIDSQTYHDIFL